MNKNKTGLNGNGSMKMLVMLISNKLKLTGIEILIYNLLT
jgi:hypothetical protein